ncbi:hypothetical protein [Streptomyces cinereoruber]|uniref:hypothetical protein n=1 Tax=Streptomyces cinereoruber TaxID=67260 RepID=UPI00363D7F71
MRFHHAIHSTDDSENPIWQVIRLADEPEDYDGTAAQYGRDVLDNWLTDERSEGFEEFVDEYGNPYRRVIVRFDDEDGDIAAIIGSDDLEEPPAELAAVEAARDAKLYARHLDSRADDQLANALNAARAKGHGANELFRRQAPALSRPVALRIMRAGADA